MMEIMKEIKSSLVSGFCGYTKSFDNNVSNTI